MNAIVYQRLMRPKVHAALGAMRGTTRAALLKALAGLGVPSAPFAHVRVAPDAFFQARRNYIAAVTTAKAYRLSTLEADLSKLHDIVSQWQCPYCGFSKRYVRLKSCGMDCAGLSQSGNSSKNRGF